MAASQVSHAKIRKTNELYEYRSYTINKDFSHGEPVLWVETPTGPFDVETMKAARESIDILIEDAETDQEAPMIGDGGTEI